MKLTIGLVGKMRSGKGTVEKIITSELQARGLSVVSHRFSDILRETESMWYLSPGRDSQQKIVLAMRQYFGEDILSRAVGKRAINTHEDVVILDGLRWIKSDYPLLRSLPNSYLFYIEAPTEIRWERSKKGTHKPDEIAASFEEFLERDNIENELEIPLFKEQADFIIDNSKDGEDNLREQVKLAMAGLSTLP